MTSRGRRNRFSSAVDYLVGYDLFISYSRKDGAAYVRALKDQLDAAGISCFLDSEEVASGSELKPALVRALRRSSALVVVVSARAKSSPYVALEIEEFARKRRPIMPILPAGGDFEVPWCVVRERELVWIEESAGSLAAGQPSADAVASVKRSLQVTRRRALATRLMLGTAAVILLLSLGVFFVAMRYIAEAAEAKRQQQIAERKRHDALVQQQIAERETHDALVQQQIAQKATSEAEQRKVVATVESLARQAVIGNRDDRLSLLLAVEAVSRASAVRSPALATAEHALRQAVARASGVPLLPMFPGRSENYRAEGALATYDGRWLALATHDGSHRIVALYDLTDPNRGPVHRFVSPEAVLPGPFVSLAVSRDGRFVVAGTFTLNRVMLGTIGNGGAKVRFIDDGDDFQDMGVFRPQITADRRWLCLDKSLFDLRVGTEKPVVKVAPGFRLTLSPDGQWVAETWQFWGWGNVLLQRVSPVGLEDPAALLFMGARVGPALPGDPTPAPQEPPARVVQSTKADIEGSDIEFSSDSRWMLASSSGGTFLWDLRRPDFPRLDFMGERRPHAFSRDSRYFVIDGGLYSLAGPSPRPIPLRGNLPRHPDPTGKRATGFSPDGRWLAIADAETRVWDLRSVTDRKPRFILRGPEDIGTTMVSFSPNGRWLATGGSPSRLWDLSLPDPNVSPITLTTAEFLGDEFAFSGDSRWLVSTGSDDGGVRVKQKPETYRAWPLETPDLLRVARQLAGQPFTSAEWLTLFPEEPYPGVRPARR